MMALFSEESVVTGHPFAAESAGLTAIRAVQHVCVRYAGPARSRREPSILSDLVRIWPL